MNFKNDYDAGREPQAQKDWYNGIEFRSKLESKTAQALDNIGMRYEYEPAGYKLTNGMWYRPDFWLPDAHQFVECKGKMDSTDSAKIVGLAMDTGFPVVVLSYDNILLVESVQPEEGITAFMTHERGCIVLLECSECGKSWIQYMGNTYRCPNCGAYDGDRHIKSETEIESGQQLFSYGQEIAADKPIYIEIANNFNN